jgi:DNA-binding CsgD family transcriptional regulator
VNIWTIHVLVYLVSVLIGTTALGANLALYAVDRKTFHKYSLLVLAAMETALVSVFLLIFFAVTRQTSPVLFGAVRLLMLCGLSALLFLVPVFFFFVLGIPLNRWRFGFAAAAAAFLGAGVFLLLRSAASPLDSPAAAALDIISFAAPNAMSVACAITTFARISAVRDVFLKSTFLLINIVLLLYVPVAALEKFLLKTSFAFAIHVAIFTLLFIVPTLMRSRSIRMFDEDKRSDQFASRYRMTTREKEVALLLKEGLSSGEIAARLFISYKTVETHIYSIYRKAGIRNRVQLLNRIASPAI